MSRSKWWDNADDETREAAIQASDTTLAYCEEHGHQWAVTSGPNSDGMYFWKCRRCKYATVGPADPPEFDPDVRLSGRPDDGKRR